MEVSPGPRMLGGTVGYLKGPHGLIPSHFPTEILSGSHSERQERWGVEGRRDRMLYPKPCLRA